MTRISEEEFAALGRSPERVRLAWSEREFMAQVRKVAKAHGWMSYHTHNSRRSDEGFPDLVLAHGGIGRLIFWELKREDGEETPAQRVWIATLTACGQDASIKRPSDWQQIVATLRGKR